MVVHDLITDGKAIKTAALVYGKSTRGDGKGTGRVAELIADMGAERSRDL